MGFYRQHSRKLSFFPIIDFLSFYVGFQQIAPKGKILPHSVFSLQCCGCGVLSISGTFVCIWVVCIFSSLKSSFHWHSLFKEKKKVVLFCFVLFFTVKYKSYTRCKSSSQASPVLLFCFVFPWPHTGRLCPGKKM